MILQTLMCSAILFVGPLVCDCVQNVSPLTDIFEVVQNFPTTNFCNRTFVSNWWLGPNNTRMVTFNGPILECETAPQVCHCFYNLISQKDWLEGAGKKCYHHRCNNTVTLEFSGQPDPTYSSNAKPKLDRPLKKMKVIAEQFGDNTQMFGIRCRSYWIEDKCGCLHVMIECPLNCATDAEKFCHRILDYFNQKTDNGKGWLQDSVTHCNKRGNTLEVEFIGNTKEGVNCTAPRYYKYDELIPSLVFKK